MCLGIVLAVFIASCLVIPALDTELLPKVDQGQFTIKLDLPPGTKLDFTDSVVNKIEAYLFDMPSVESVTVNIGSTKEKKGTALLETMGSHQAQLIVNLKPKSGFGKTGPGYRAHSTADILQKIKNQITLQDLSGASVEYILQESVFQTAFQAGAPVVIEIKGRELGTLRRITAEVEDNLKKIPGIYSIRNTLVAPAPEVKVNVFKDKAATYNLSTSDIALTAQTAIKGYIATKFKKEGEEIDIKVQLRQVDRDDMSKVRQIKLNSPLGIDVPLAEVAYLSMGTGPSEIKRQDQERMVAVSASIFQKPFKEVADAVTAILSRLNMPTAYSAKLTGEREQIQESFKSLQMALLLSILLVYMIMASQFESLWQPFVILFTIPLSIIGVIAILFVTGTPLSVMVILGVIVLGGVVVNNGIVLIDYTNILRAKGMSAYDAVITSSRRRLRPIIMTALTTILGLVPLALALNQGAELQQPMAIAVIGGLALSTFLSLVVIPTIYLGLDNVIASMKKKKSRPACRIGRPEDDEAAPGEDNGPEPPAPDTMPDSSPSTQNDSAVLSQDDIKVESPKIQYEDDIVKDSAPHKKDIEEDENKPPIILPYEPEKSNKETMDIESFSERQKSLIEYLRQNKKITRKEYADRFNVSIPTASRDLKDLLKAGIIVPKGPAAVGRYYVLDDNYSV
jgi:hydrophobic/amphiphilic exporter-1 (mainly G- bacteria), HAE1 family